MKKFKNRKKCCIKLKRKEDQKIGKVRSEKRKDANEQNIYFNRSFASACKCHYYDIIYTKNTSLKTTTKKLRKKQQTNREIESKVENTMHVLYI